MDIDGEIREVRPDEGGGAAVENNVVLRVHPSGFRRSVVAPVDMRMELSGSILKPTSKYDYYDRDDEFQNGRFFKLDPLEQRKKLNRIKDKEFKSTSLKKTEFSPTEILKRLPVEIGEDVEFDIFIIFVKPNDEV